MKSVRKDHVFYREIYEKTKNISYDANMEYEERADVGSGSWVFIIATVPVSESCRPQLYGIYWGVPKQDSFDRQVCVVHTTEDVTLLNHEYTVLSEEKVEQYRNNGWVLHEINSRIDRPLNLELIERGRSLCEEEREIIWALQLDGLSEEQSCEEYFFSKHTDYNNSTICFLPTPKVYWELVVWCGER